MEKSAKKTITAYFALSLLLTIPMLIPIWFINNLIWYIVYFLFLFLYTRIVVIFVARATIMSSLLKDLNSEKYAAIIKARPFQAHYSYKLNLYFAIGDYQAAYNVISSVLINHKNISERIYGHLLLCRICFERGEYDGLKENLYEIDNYLKYNSTIKLSKQNKRAYAFYQSFSNADYSNALALLEKDIEKYSKSKNNAYRLIMAQYRLAVVKRINGEIDEAVLLFESIREKAPMLVVSRLAQKQIEIISGTIDEEMPERLEVTEKYTVKSHRAIKAIYVIAIVIICISFVLMLVGKIISQVNAPKQENKDMNYIAALKDSISDDYDECQILGYFNIYTDYAEQTYKYSIDALFLVESDGRLDLHTFYRFWNEPSNYLNVKDVKVGEVYEYETYFTPYKIEFVLTEKKRDIPNNSLYYYEIDGYYFCVLGISYIH